MAIKPFIDTTSGPASRRADEQPITLPSLEPVGRAPSAGQGRIRRSSAADGPGFCPEDYFARALDGVGRIGGRDMYRLLDDAGPRGRLLELAGQVEQAWDTAERNGLWSDFVRAVDRLRAGWCDLLAAS